MNGPCSELLRICQYQCATLSHSVNYMIGTYTDELQQSDSIVQRFWTTYSEGLSTKVTCVKKIIYDIWIYKQSRFTNDCNWHENVRDFCTICDIYV